MKDTLKDEQLPRMEKYTGKYRKPPGQEERILAHQRRIQAELAARGIDSSKFQTGKTGRPKRKKKQ